MDRAHLEAFPTFAGLFGEELGVLAEALKEVSVGAGAEIVTLDDYAPPSTSSSRERRRSEPRAVRTPRPSAPATRSARSGSS